MLASFARDSVTVIRPARVVDHGAMVSDWTDTTETVVNGCSVQPAPGGEDQDHRDASERLWTLWAPGTTDIAATDRVRFDGSTYEVVGQPQWWRVPGSTLHHVQVTLRLWEG